MYALFDGDYRVTDWAESPDAFDKTHPRDINTHLRLVKCDHRKWKEVIDEFVPLRRPRNSGIVTHEPIKKECVLCEYRQHENGKEK
jgi:hypothetical protein